MNRNVVSGEVGCWVPSQNEPTRYEPAGRAFSSCGLHTIANQERGDKILSFYPAGEGRPYQEIATELTKRRRG
jgi:hypothetical protein